MIRGEYLAKFPQDTTYIEAGVEPVPIDWINQRLVELRENWRVDTGLNGYILPALASPETKPAEPV
jgi:hypothetical protein